MTNENSASSVSLMLPDSNIEIKARLSRVLSYLAGNKNIEIDHLKVRHAIEQAIEESPGSVEKTWSERLVMAGTLIGERVTLFQATLKEAADFATPKAPVATCFPGPDGNDHWLVILEQKGRHFRIANLDDFDEDQWLSEKELSNEFGISSTDRKRNWVIAHQATPLLDLENPPTDADHHGSDHHDDEHSTISPFRRLLGLLRSERKDIRTVILYAIGIGIFTLATPIAVESLVNSVAFGTYQQLLVLAFMLFCCLAFSAVLYGIQSYIVEIMQQRIFVRVTADLAYRLPRVRAEAFDRNHGPELVNRFFEVLTVQKASAVLLLDGLSVVLQTIIGMMLLAFYHPLLLGFDAFLVFAIVFILLGLGRGGVRTSIQESRAKYSVAGWLEDIARNPTTFKTSGGPAYAQEKADELAKQYILARRSHWNIVFRQIIGSLALQAVASTLLLGLGGWLVISPTQTLTLGQLVAAELVVAMILTSVAKLGKSLHSYYDLMASMDKLGHLVDLPLERLKGEPMEHEKNSLGLQVHDISFEYHPNHPILENVSFSIRPGEKVALVGETGRKTLLELLYGLREPTKGHIEIDGVDIRELRLEVLRQYVSVVSQPEIFEGTILDNIRMGRNYIGIIDVRHALEEVGLFEEVMHFHDGLYTKLATGGNPLSRAQAYQLALARAIVGRPRLLVVDRVLDQFPDAIQQRLLDLLTSDNAPWSLILISNNREVLSICKKEIRLKPANHSIITNSDLTNHNGPQKHN